MSNPMPDPMRIIQLVSVLLSIKYNKTTNCTKTLVTIDLVRSGGVKTKRDNQIE